MRTIRAGIPIVAVSLCGCASNVDLTALRNEKCNSPAANSNAIGAMTNTLPQTLSYAPTLSATLSSNSVPPPITKANVADGSKLLNTTDATVEIPRPPGVAPRIKANSVLPNAPQHVVSSESDVSDEEVQGAQDARAQIRNLLGTSPLSASNFISDGSNLKASIGTIGKSSVSSIGEINKTLQTGGYESLAKASADQLNKANQLQLSDSQKVYLNQELQTARFLATYYWAYFRGGHILQVSVDTKSLMEAGTQSIESKVDKALSDATRVGNLTSAQKTAVTNVMSQLKSDLGGELTQMSANICKDDQTSANGVCLLTQPLGNVSFVSRAGTSIQFSGETVTVGTNGKFTPSTTKISTTVVGPQMAQVLWEAVFDSFPPFVPASANSTACVNKLYEPSLCIDKNTPKATLDQIDTVDADATSAEATTAAVTGYIIRGGWLFSLNNEAVAEVVETSAGEIARKTTEKLVWVHLNSDCKNQAIHPTVSTLKGS